MSKITLLFTAVVALLIRGSNPYSMGAPDQACKRMVPGHGFDPQDGSPPVELKLSKRDEIKSGDKIDLEIASKDPSVPFKGFILQVRTTSGEDIETPIGHFETEEASFMTCGKGIHNSLTHRNSEDKTSIKAKWRSPADFEGEVYFRFSTAVEYDKYWVNVDSPKIRVERSAGGSNVDADATPTANPDIIVQDDVGESVPIDQLLEETPAIPPVTLTTPEEPSNEQSSTTQSTTTSTTTTSTTLRTTSELRIESIPRSNKIFEGCGSSKTCFGMPSDCVTSGGCQAVVSYELSKDEMLFKMVGKTDGYVSVGLSYDSKMDNALTTSCYYNPNNGEVGVQTGFNKGYSNIPLHPPKLNITTFAGKYDEGFIDCHFSRPQSVKFDENGGTPFNLFKDNYVILLAEGPFRDGRIAKHRSKNWSSEPKSLGSVSNLESDLKIKLKLHGAFMIGAWIFSASLGIVLARYFKQTWTGSKCCKLDQWFIFHRLLMITTWSLTIAGFILIFAELDFTWTAIPIDQNPHAVLGCITTGLCFIQPFMALLRCHPGTPRRPIFNWLHWFVGNSAHIIGVVAIFFAVDLDRAELPKETDFLLIAFVAFHFLMHLTFSLMMCISERQKKKKGKYAPNGTNGSNYPMHHLGYGRAMPPVHPYPDYEELKGDEPGSGLRKFFLAVYIIVAALVAAALIALVVLAPSRDLLVRAKILKN